MANTPSQLKRNRQNEKRRLRNRTFRGTARGAVKTAMNNMSAEQASAAGINEAIRALDKAARMGSIHHRNAARRKSRLMKRLAAVGLKLPSRTAQADSVAVAAAPETKAKKPAAKKVAKKAASKKTAGK